MLQAAQTVLVQSHIPIRDPGVSSPPARLHGAQGMCATHPSGFASQLLQLPTTEGMLEITNSAPVGNYQLCPVPTKCCSHVLRLPRASPSSGCLGPAETITSAQLHVRGVSFSYCRLPPSQSGAPVFSVPQCRSSTGQCWALNSQEGTGAPCVGCRTGPRGVCCNPSPALLCLLPLPAFLQAPWGSACYSIQSPALS